MNGLVDGWMDWKKECFAVKYLSLILNKFADIYVCMLFLYSVMLM